MDRVPLKYHLPNAPFQKPKGTSEVLNGNQSRITLSLFEKGSCSEKKRDSNAKFRYPPKDIVTDYDNGQFFRAMEWFMFFFRPPLISMVFNGLDTDGPTPSTFYEFFF